MKSTITKHSIAKSFSNAAHSYDSVASLQRAVGIKLLAHLPTLPNDSILDLGCGTGYFLKKITETCVSSNILGIDLAEGMVKYAQRKCTNDKTLLVCADAEFLPLKSESMSLVFSSMALQWCANLTAVFAEAMRILKPGGTLGFSVPGPKTLTELKASWKQVDSHVHVNDFIDLIAIEQMAKAVGFSSNTYTETRIMHYQKLSKLMAELKALGASNLNSTRLAGLTGRSKIQSVITKYEYFRDSNGLLPATWQVYYVVLSKPK